tara:strand:+ start:394 stop:738 length:345 start_codon:yes stop_codon:yes gene_type:complete
MSDIENPESFDDFVKQIEEEMKDSPPPEFPFYYWNHDGEMIEVYLTNEVSYHKWINHNLTLIKKEKVPDGIVDDGKSKPDSIIGFEIWDFFGLMRKCFDKETAVVENQGRETGW